MVIQLPSKFTLGEKHFTEKEKQLINSIKWMKIDEAIEFEEKTKRTNISTLVINRELPILKIARDMLKAKK